MTDEAGSVNMHGVKEVIVYNQPKKYSTWVTFTWRDTQYTVFFEKLELKDENPCPRCGK